MPIAIQTAGKSGNTLVLFIDRETLVNGARETPCR